MYDNFSLSCCLTHRLSYVNTSRCFRQQDDESRRHDPFSYDVRFNTFYLSKPHSNIICQQKFYCSSPFPLYTCQPKCNKVLSQPLLVKLQSRSMFGAGLKLLLEGNHPYVCKSEGNKQVLKDV